MSVTACLRQLSCRVSESSEDPDRFKPVPKGAPITLDELRKMFKVMPRCSAFRTLRESSPQQRYRYSVCDVG
jgi:hypothetical protein